MKKNIKRTHDLATAYNTKNLRKALAGASLIVVLMAGIYSCDILGIDNKDNAKDKEGHPARQPKSEAALMFGKNYIQKGESFYPLNDGYLSRYQSEFNGINYDNIFFTAFWYYDYDERSGKVPEKWNSITFIFQVEQFKLPQDFSMVHIDKINLDGLMEKPMTGFPDNASCIGYYEVNSDYLTYDNPSYGQNRLYFVSGKVNVSFSEPDYTFFGRVIDQNGDTIKVSCKGPVNPLVF
jgi:hypothetical protein